MLPSRTRFPTVLLVVSLLAACGRTHPVAAQSALSAQSSPIPRSREANDVARFLAGMPGEPGSPYAALEESQIWKDHRAQLDAAWGKASEELLKNLRAFEEADLRDKGLDNRTVFYPFSGPDILTPLYYFPRSPLYIMVALEPAGTFPDAAQLSKNETAKYLGLMRLTTADILGRSFFITRQMDKQLRGQVTDGALLPLLHLLVRTGHTILGLRYVRVDENGQIAERPALFRSEDRYANRGVELEFQAGQSAPQRLYYFSVNIDNAHLSNNQPFMTYLKSVRNTTSMFKATSYMVHRPEFSIIREHTLANSKAILQDDSGIPYHLYTPERWKVMLFGEYTKPYGKTFAWLEQKDLRAAYQKGTATPIPLHVGYGYRRVNSNLQLALAVESTAAK